MNYRAGHTILESFLGGSLLAAGVGFGFWALGLAWPVSFALAILFWLIGIFGFFHLLHRWRSK